MTEQKPNPEVGDLVFLLDKKKGCRHRGRAIVKAVDGDHLEVLPVPRHRQTHRVHKSRVKVWLAQKIKRANRRRNNGNA